MLTYFTFQSGSIQIEPTSIFRENNFILYIPIWFYSNVASKSLKKSVSLFTFQSGSIQIEAFITPTSVIFDFTFQSGSIQILQASQLRTHQKDFTFQSGSIQMV